MALASFSIVVVTGPASSSQEVAVSLNHVPSPPKNFLVPWNSLLKEEA